MSENTVIRLTLAAPPACQNQVVTWEEIARQADPAPVQVLFASTKSFVENAVQLRRKLENGFNIPPSFFDRLLLQSNGFADHAAQLNCSKQVQAYTYWCRFTVKQTYDKLRLKRTFTPHISNHQPGLAGTGNTVVVHGPQSVEHGWEWYEMGFFASWKPTGALTLICFDLPTKSQSSIQSMLGSDTVDLSSPYSIFSIISDELLRLYDDSVWSIRNHISQWEAGRSNETDYILLHEIARHGVHVDETLSVAVRSLHAIQKHHEELRLRIDPAVHQGKDDGWDTVRDRLSFQHRFLENLLERSHANNARIQNEIALAFNTRAQRDSKTQVRIGEESRKEASAMKAIAVITVMFLPATFVSTLFGTNFFSFEAPQPTNGAVFAVSGYFWVYWAISAPMTIAALALWFFWSKWESSRNRPATRSLPVASNIV